MFNIDTQTDVQAAEVTAPDSSAVEQTTTTDAVVETAPVEDRGQTVPYDRFREVNEKAKRVEELERKLADIEARVAPQQPANPQADAIKEQLKAMGFAPREEVIAEIRQEQMQKEQDAQIRQEVKDLSQRYSGTDGRPKFDGKAAMQYAVEHGINSLEAAYKLMHEKELTDWNIQQAISKSRGVQTEGSDGSGSSQVGTTNDDLRREALSGNEGAIHALVKRVTARK